MMGILVIWECKVILWG